MELTDEQLRTLRHMLGISDLRKKEPESYRNYYCANHGDPNMAALVEAGAVRMYNRDDQYEWFTCTDAGQVAAVASFYAGQATKKQRVYMRFLGVKDVFPDLTFREFLTSKRFGETRASA